MAPIARSHGTRSVSFAQPRPDAEELEQRLGHRHHRLHHRRRRHRSRIVAPGLAIAITGEDTVAPADSGVIIRPLPCDDPPARRIVAVWLRNRRVPAAERMLPLLVDTAAAHIGQRSRLRRPHGEPR
jgi:DNA-binding transcriptional LysR family regulator